jgi:hypothetical protein
MRREWTPEDLIASWTLVEDDWRTPDQLASYAWSGRTIEYHRAQIRAALGFREPTLEDVRPVFGKEAE